MSQLGDSIARFRRELADREQAAADVMTRQYAGTYKRLSASLDELTSAMVAAQKDGKEITADLLFRHTRTQLLLEQVKQEMDRFAVTASQETVKAQADSVRMAGEHSVALIEQAPGPLPKGTPIPEGFAKFNPASVEELIGRTAAGSPVRTLLEPLGATAVDVVRGTLVEHAVKGASPRTAAKVLRQELGVPLARALTISRTETLGAYREASIRTYAENPQVVQGWRWTAALSPRTCPMCLAMDGKTFPSSTPFGSHPNCRCTSIPITPSWEELGFTGITDWHVDLPKGADWFAKQSHDVKRRILGPTKLRMYEEEQLTLDTLVGYRNDKTWGPNRWERSIKHIREGKYKPPKAAWGLDKLPPVKPEPVPVLPPVPVPKPEPLLIGGYKPLSSYTEAVTWAEANLAEYTEDLEQVPLAVLNDFFAEFYAVKLKHNLPKLTEISGRTREASSVAEIVQEGQFTNLTINGKFMRQLEADGISPDNWVKAQHESGFLAGQSMADIAYHEAAHYYYRKGLNGSQREQVAEAFTEAGYVDAFKYVSRLSAVNEREFHAEAAVVVRRGGLAALGSRDVANAIKGVLP